MMDITTQITYVMRFKHREMKMIRRALEIEGSVYAKELCEKITEDIRRTAGEIKTLSAEINLSIEESQPKDGMKENKRVGNQRARRCIVKTIEQIRAEILKQEDILITGTDAEKKEAQKKIDELLQEYQDLLIKKGEL